MYSGRESGDRVWRSQRAVGLKTVADGSLVRSVGLGTIPLSTENNPSRSRIPRRWRFIIAFVLVVIVGLLWSWGRAYLDLATWADREVQLREIVSSNFFTSWLVLFAIYVLVTSVSIPGATGLTLLCGWLLGFWPALCLVSFASTLGATLAFASSRFFLKDWVRQRWPQQVEQLLRQFEQDGTNYLLTMRLIPAIPFFLINLLMGVTRIRTAQFWWISQLGMLPATIVYVYAGANLPSLQTVADRGWGHMVSWQLLFALSLLALVPWLLKWGVSYWGRR
jgi:uncharacterized membrane protein YdjX (TVP38/TMEM64 family)